MPLHFSEAELAARRAATCRALTEAGLDGLLMFRQESMFYLTGYDTFGYVFFQCLYLSADGELVLLTRAPDLRQAEQTSVVEDIRIWVDAPDARPALELKAILEEKGCKGGRLGVEYEAYGLTGRNCKRLEAALEGFCTLEDASLLVSRQRVVKSPAEIDYARTAGRLADAAWDAALGLAGPGADEGAILAAMQGAIFAGGGDYPGNEFIIGSGPQALLCRYYTGRRALDPKDQLTLEWAGAYRHYHAAMMRTLTVGGTPPRQREMHQVARDALLAVEERLRPGGTVGAAFDAHAEVLDRAGYRAHRMNACGYSLGTTFSPNWMDWPMLYRGNPVVLEPGMVFFVHIIIFDSEQGLAMSLGRTSLVTEGAAEPLSAAPLDLVER
ncbi:Xaa-Pro dipeptidase [Tistlia consotensis]|uniref:Xaa-Pro dipeptidase n=1 Tax=Tistlia consotensis USBA 355 TaxID=560819 RepID=A0A1Y6CB94_9PROT|nr:Xaa-Pro peptidase family protein [Tistlia consotensis]SMF46331.1 Xaa-Pro dipeptidase [Tistlia consotensis USBA 355]SNR78616.1 Xaa-Pro dipeptidase [Tistlia consotensis]